MVNSRSDPGRTTLPALLAVSALLLGLGVLALVARMVIPHGLRWTLFVSELALVTPAALALLAYGIPPKAGLALRAMSRRTWVVVALMGASLWVASLGLLELQYAVWPPGPGYLEAFRTLHEALRPAGPFDALVSVMVIALIPATCEEALLRGVVLPSLQPHLGAGGAIAVSAALFAVIHLDPYRTLFTLTIGLVLGVLRVRTGSLFSSLTAHAVLNTITFVAAPLMEDPSETLPPARPIVGLALLVVGGAVSYGLLRLLPSLTSPRTPPRLAS